MSIQDEFIATVSHEMRTPLTSIRGFSQTLLNSWDKIKDEDKKKFIGIIEDQSNRLIHLVENILSVSKMNAGNQVLKQVDINACIKRVLPMLEEQHKQNKFETKLSKENPIAYIDEDKFQQIMTNLIDNAGKYSEKDIIVSTEIQNDWSRDFHLTRRTFTNFSIRILGWKRLYRLILIVLTVSLQVMSICILGQTLRHKNPKQMTILILYTVAN